MTEFWLVDMSFDPPLVIDRGSYDDMQATLEEVAQVTDYHKYKIMTTFEVEKWIKI